MRDPQDIKLCAIVAMAQNNVIGGNNALLWHIPADLKHFKRTTMGKPLIMGRKTFESLPGILPGRPHIIISRRGGGVVKSIQSTQTTPSQTTPPQSNDNTVPPNAHHTIQYVTSIDAAIDTARDLACAAGQNEIFIAGGGDIYRQTLPNVARLYLTVVHRDYEGDTVFPAIDWDTWTIVSKNDHAANGDRPAFTIYVLERA